MKVIFLESIAGQNFVYFKGDEVDIPDGKAKTYSKMGLCKIIGDVFKDKPIAKPVLQTKEDYQNLLDRKGIKYDGRWGLNKLKSLI